MAITNKCRFCQCHSKIRGARGKKSRTKLTLSKIKITSHEI